MKTFAILFAACLAVATAASDKKVVCYFGSWSVYRPGDGEFKVEDINPKLCTHLIYSFVGITDSGEVQNLDAWNDLTDGGGKGNFKKFNDLRQQSPGTKTMIAIGGWNEGSGKYSRVAADPNLRRKFVDSVVAFVKKHGFDGFDVDWEYPGQRDGSSPSDKQNYVQLLKELRQRFDKEGFILSAAVAAAETSASKSYDIAQVAKYLDFINLMAYDLHGSWDKKTGMNAPLYAAQGETGGNAKLNVDAAVRYWLSQGAPAEKIILGVPFYGRGFTLNNPQSNGLNAPSNSPARAGPYTKEAGMLGYNEICEMFKNEKWNIKYDVKQRVPYAVKGDQWVSYDDEGSIKEKTDYVKKLGLGGAMVWSIETDDFRGKCGDKYPLLKTLNSELRNGAPPKVDTPPRFPQSDDEPQQNDPWNQPQQSDPWNEPQQTDPWNEPQESDPWNQPQQSDPWNEPQESDPWNEPQQNDPWNEPQQSDPWDDSPQNEPQSGNDGSVCQQEGYIRDPQDCSVFYSCVAHEGGFIAHRFECPAGLVFNNEIKTCDHAYNVQC